MPIDRTIRQERDRELALLIDEAKRRGLEVPTHKKTIKFSVDSNGFFVKEDGTKYDPLDENGVYRESTRFVESTSVLSALISGRSGGKSAAGAQKALRKVAKGESGAIFNPVFEDLKTSTWAEFRQWCPWDMVCLLYTSPSPRDRS